MKRMNRYVAAAVAAALAVGVMAGCSSQAASSESTSAESASAAASAPASESASASAAVEQSQEELIAEFKDAVANAPEFKSVTLKVEASTELAGEDSSAEEPIKEVTIYKFDASGDKLKTSSETEISDVKLQYFTDGDDAVFVTDGPVYSGTVEQFGLSHTDGVQAYLNDSIGDLNVLADCAALVEKLESNGMTFYTLTLDPQKYIDSDEVLSVMAESGTKVEEALLTVGFEEDGSIASIDEAITFDTHKMVTNIMFSDYDSTVIDPMPEANRTYEDMEADSELKLDAFVKQLEMTEEEANASEAAEAK